MQPTFPVLPVTAALAGLLLLAGHTQARAQSINDSLITFCGAIRRINAQGLSAAPGTAASQLILRNTSQTQSDYRMVWQFAKGSTVSSCRGIW
jgi:hypothetical protein